MAKLKPFFQDVQAHYDLSDDFYRLFLDSSMTYSCAFFPDPATTLEEAQRSKIDLSLGKCHLEPGLRLLDIGCGWGATALRAAEQFGVHVIGLTLSRNQHSHCNRLAAGRSNVEFRLQGWEEFDEPVDRIVSIGAFEHFRIERYAAFFQRCRKILPPDGWLLLHSIVQGSTETIQAGLPEFDFDLVQFMKFVKKAIFPGGQIPPRRVALESAQANGFELVHVESLRPHYARTLDLWAARLERSRDEAISLTSTKVYDDYMRYLTGCAHYFRTGHCDVCQFTLRPQVPDREF
jgi:cyclopropane-fatty-acyl-phospholipid synthase